MLITQDRVAALATHSLVLVAGGVKVETFVVEYFLHFNKLCKVLLLRYYYLILLHDPRLSPQFCATTLDIMARPKKCSKCGHQHNPPRGKRCVYMDEVDDVPPIADDDIAIPPPEDIPVDIPVDSPPLTPQGPPQQQVLETVLETLQNINQRLDILERQPTVAAGIIPGPADRELRENMHARMAMLNVQQDSDSGSEDWELAGAGAGRPRARTQAEGKNTSGGKPVRSKRSGAVRVATDCVIWDIDWPHYHTERGPGRAPVQYDDLTIAEFVTGYMYIVNCPQTPTLVRTNMLHHLQNLMTDATRQPWHVVRHFHRSVLVHMEMGLITWENMDSIKEMRANIRSEAFSVAAPGGGKKPPSGPSTRSPAAYCVPFQTNTCKFTGDHGNLRHICAFCQLTTGGNYTHGEFECRRKGAQNPAKNA
jgi:hypothetical protein